MATRPDLFAFTLAQIRNGAAGVEASDKLTECVTAARETGKAAELVIKIKIKPDGRDSGQYFIEESIVNKLPKPERGKTLFFGTPDGNLTRDNPRQQSLELQKVESDRPSIFKKAENE
jgi:hypothetical protein